MYDMEAKLGVFSDMMLKVWKVFFWQYDSENILVSSTCPNEELFDNLITVGGCKSRLVDACLTNKKASMVADFTGLIWIAVPHFDGDALSKWYVIGPVFASEVSENNMMSSVRDKAIPTEWRMKMLECLRNLPVIHYSAFNQFGVVLQYYVNGLVINASDMLVAQAGKQKASLAVDSETQDIEREGSYSYETKIMNAIETGNISFKRPAHPPKVGKMSKGDPVRQARNMIHSFITITARAALRGGMQEDTAYGLSDQYIQSLENETDIAKIQLIGSECYNDFLHRMYKLKLSQGRSREIQNCISYIEAHLHEKIDYKDMAKQCGYSRNYLSVKFKSEMGESMVNYITKQRIAQAKLMLRNSKDSISTIAASLMFSSNSYFGSIFHNLVGVTPGEYRNGLS